MAVNLQWVEQTLANLEWTGPFDGEVDEPFPVFVDDLGDTEFVDDAGATRFFDDAFRRFDT